jgi:hypothetical protein
VTGFAIQPKPQVTANRDFIALMQQALANDDAVDACSVAAPPIGDPPFGVEAIYLTMTARNRSIGQLDVALGIAANQNLISE